MAPGVNIFAIKTLVTPLVQLASPVIRVAPRENVFVVPIMIGLEACASINVMLRLIAMGMACATLMLHQRETYVIAIKTGISQIAIFIAMIRQLAMTMENVQGNPTRKFAVVIRIMLAKTVNSNATMTKRVTGKVFVEPMGNVYAIRVI